MTRVSVDVLYTKFTKHLSEVVWDELLTLLPPELLEKNRRYVRWQDRHAHLLGKYLLLQGLKKYDLGPEVLSQLKYSKYSRPFLDHSIDFNISHSHEYVICAFTKECKIGVDVEEVKDVDFADFKNVMTPVQWKRIENASDPMQDFFKMWTIKEAVIKSHGNGLSIPLEDIHVVEGDRKAVLWDQSWYLNDLNIDQGYHCTLCSSQPVDDLNTEQIIVG